MIVSTVSTRLTTSSSTMLPFAGVPGACGRCGRKNHRGLCPPAQGSHRKHKKKVAVEQPSRGIVVVGSGKMSDEKKLIFAKKRERAKQEALRAAARKGKK